MEMIENKIDGVKIIKSPKYLDSRGYFSELYRYSAFNQLSINNVDLNQKFPQINESYSKKNTFRGLHYQNEPPQAKCIRCLSGKIIDVLLDINPSSANFGNIYTLEIESDLEKNEINWIWIPENYAHGFLALEDSILQYMCTNEWNADSSKELSIFSDEINWNNSNQILTEKLLSIINSEKLIISEKDKNATKFQKGNFR